MIGSNLLLGEKTVRTAEGGAPNSFGKMGGGNQWDALRASHLLALKKPLRSVLVLSIVPSSHLFSKQMIRRKPHALASTPATPKRKNVPCSFDFRGGGFFLKRKGHFFFLGFCLPSIRAVRGASIWTRLISRPQEGSGEECGRVSDWGFSPPNFVPVKLAHRQSKTQFFKKTGLVFSTQCVKNYAGQNRKESE